MPYLRHIDAMMSCHCHWQLRPRPVPGLYGGSSFLELSKEVVVPRREIATLAGGCFWCLEAVYLELRGVLGVQSGYAGGHVPLHTSSYEGWGTCPIPRTSWCAAARRATPRSCRSPS